MAVAKYRDPATGDWVEITGLGGTKGPAGPKGPPGAPGAAGGGISMSAASARYIDTAGDTLQGDLVLSGDPIINVGTSTAPDSVATVGQIEAARTPELAILSDSRPAAMFIPNPMWVDTSKYLMEWDTDWVLLVGENGWYAAGDGVHPPPACRLMPDGRVQLRGRFVHSGTPSAGEVMAIMPTGYKHNSALIFSIYGYTTKLTRFRVDVRSGNLVFYSTQDNSTGTFVTDLDTISYTPEA